MGWVLLSILASLIWAATNLVDKYIVDRWFKHPQAATLAFTWIAAISGFVVWGVKGFFILPFWYAMMGLGTGLCISFMSFFYFKALQYEEVSRVLGLFWLSTIYVAILGGIFLGEVFAPITYLGVVLLVAGAVLLSYKKGEFRFSKAFIFIQLSGLAAAVQTVLLKGMLNHYDYWSVYAYSRASAIFAAIPLSIMLIPAYKETMRRIGGRVLWVQLLNEVGNIGAVVASYAAMALGPITLVSALGSLSPLFVLMLAVVISIFLPKILNEEIKGTSVLLKFLAMAIMFVGALLVT